MDFPSTDKSREPPSISTPRGGSEKRKKITFENLLNIVRKIFQSIFGFFNIEVSRSKQMSNLAKYHFIRKSVIITETNTDRRPWKKGNLLKFSFASLSIELTAFTDKIWSSTKVKKPFWQKRFL